VKMLDVTAPGSGNVATAFIDPTRPANRPLLEASIYEDTVSQWEELACGYD